MPKHEPERTCIVTREVKAPAAMIRFVLDPENRVVADLRGKLPGRGAWVTARADTVGEAVRRKLFSRAFKRESAASPTLPADIDAALLADLRAALSLANKAGAATAGFGKVEAAIAARQVAALLHASEAAPDGRRKLAAALRRQVGDPIISLPTFDVFSGDELDMALGRVGVIHAAVLKGAGSLGFLARLRRLRTYRGEGEDEGQRPSPHASDLDELQHEATGRTTTE
jgi:predicted RNA-binding protein YlxR (DUF448 family)